MVTLLIDQDENYIFVGRTMSFGAGKRDTYMVKTDSDGFLLEETLFGGAENDWLDDIIEFDSAYYLVGESNSFGAKNDIYLVRHNR